MDRLWQQQLYKSKELFYNINDMTFQQKLDNIIDKNNSLLCIGLDPVMEKLPKPLQNNDFPFFAFNKTIIDATHDLVCAYKPNSAFYEALGEKGIGELKRTCDYLRTTYQEIPIILDAKRGDIGSTNEGYVTYCFDYLSVDAVTLYPYLGRQAMEPFLKEKEKGLIFLCKTSNPNSGEFQNIFVIASEEKQSTTDAIPVQAGIQEKSMPLYQYVAKQIAQEWNSNNNCLLVVGATYPEELAAVRKIVGEMTLLIPGIGAQGGEVGTTMKAGLNSRGKGMIISSSRGIIFAKNPREEAEKLRDEINNYR